MMPGTVSPPRDQVARQPHTRAMYVYERDPRAIRLAAAAELDPRTAARWLSGLGVQRASATLLAAAAERLGIERPDPDPPPSPRRRKVAP